MSCSSSLENEMSKLENEINFGSTPSPAADGTGLKGSTGRRGILRKPGENEKQNKQSRRTSFVAWKERDIEATIAVNEDNKHQLFAKVRTTEEGKK